MQAYIVFSKESELDIGAVTTGTFIYVWDSSDPSRKLGFKTREGTVCWIAFGAEEETEKAAEVSSTAS